MKAKLLIVLLSSFNLFAQIKFEKGYFIDSQNRKVECLIENQDWINPPKQIEYKLSEESMTEIINLSQINSFQIYGTSQYYIKSIVNVDKSLSGDYNPKPETIILKVLVDGIAKLYYNDDIFFYQINNGEIKQLVYKKEKDNISIKEDNLFRVELYNNLKTTENQIEIRKLEYKKNALVNFFINYNKHTNSDYTIFTSKETTIKFNFNVLAGLNFTNGSFTMSGLYIAPGSSGGEIQLKDADLVSKNKINIVLGFEIEALLPFNKNRWAIFVSPNYQQSKYELSKGNVNPIGQFGTAFLNSTYSYIDIPLGVRRYFDLNANSKLFLDGALNLTILTSIEEKRSFINNYGNLSSFNDELKSKSFSAAARIGLGYNYENKYSLSLNYFIVKKLSNIDVGSLTLLASYKLF
ncbi:outer membrane protein with beta-barrel domain [Flavobacterium dankookense]|uniref:Outer membrane protein with beta-barrel domain n=1 Tax=Flavobacterium dankookense TaxID=706186 RepID=A0A4R6QFB8_9FLAO|nr:outer membrane protein with beta-barrel domain [Flavobacterium dankookense]